MDFADWLFAHIGPTDDFLVYDEALNTPDKNIIFAGRIEFKLSAKARYIRSGCGIEAGEVIKAGEGIKAGWGIEAGEVIKAGGGYGIFAGQAVEVCNWDISAVVTAKTRPENLISGFWKERDE